MKGICRKSSSEWIESAVSPSSLKSFRSSLKVKLVSDALDNRKTNSVDGHAIADNNLTHWMRDREDQTAAGTFFRDLNYFSQRFNQASKHDLEFNNEPNTD